MTATKVQAWVHFNRAPSELYIATTTDGTEKELTSQSSGAALGDVAGQVVTGIDIQLGAGSILTYMQITASDAGQVINIKGGERLAAGGATTYSNLNLCAQNLSISVERGMSLNVLTLD